MKNTKSADIVSLFMWWNGYVFSFDTANKRVESNSDESSGMDEAELGLYASDDSELENLQRQEPTENRGGEEFVDGFSNLTLGASLSANSTKIDTNFIVISATGRSFFKFLSNNFTLTHL